MAIFSQGDVVRVPFPYTDRNVRQYRPALIVSKIGVGENDALIWVVMITSAENRSWPGDVSISALKKSGLPVLSTIRTAKIATIEIRHAGRLGAVEKPVFDAVLHILRQNLASSEGSTF